MATKYKQISDQIRKIEAGLYYLKLLEIDKEIRIENEINTEAEGEVEGFNNKISELENSIKTSTDKVNPLREKNIENLSRIQRLNLELQNLDEENTRTQDEIDVARSVKMEDLIHPEKDEDRAKNPEWLVMLGVCTHLGCVPLEDKGDFYGWFCPCHGSHYDTSGRIRKGPAPQNMEIPKYEFVNSNIIKIG